MASFSLVVNTWAAVSLKGTVVAYVTCDTNPPKTTPRKQDIKSIRSPATSSRRQRKWTACPLNKCRSSKGGDGNHLGFQHVERPHQVRQVCRIRQNQKIQVAAKFRRAVKYARLPPHEERSRATPPDRRKGSEYRALAQAILQAWDKPPTALRIQGSAPRGSAYTTPPTHAPLSLPREDASRFLL